MTFQLALIPGSLLAGFLLSPLLYLSRNLAQKPAHRLRFPHEKPVHRRLLALGFYAGTALVCGGLVGTWAKWCLDWRDPWVWAAMFVVEGKRWWTRPALLTYWGLLAVISVAGWSRQLVRARRHRRYDPPPQPSRAERNAQITPTTPMEHPTQTHGPGHGNGSGFAQIMDAADQRLPTFSVNARRKFFHALAVVMFVPGIAVDVRLVPSPSVRQGRADNIASIHPPVVQRSIRILQFRRICPIFRPLAFWRFSSSIPERIPRF